MCRKGGPCRNISFYCLKHTFGTSFAQHFPLKARFGTLRETLSKKDSQRRAPNRLSARFCEAPVSKCVPKGSQLSSQVVSFFACFFTFASEGLLGGQAHPRVPQKTQNGAPGTTNCPKCVLKGSQLSSKCGFIFFSTFAYEGLLGP